MNKFHIGVRVSWSDPNDKTTKQGTIIEWTHDPPSHRIFYLIRTDDGKYVKISESKLS